MTSVSEEFRRISHHGVREELLEAQAEAIGLPLTKIYLPSGKTTPCTNEVYEQIMGAGHGGLQVAGRVHRRLRRPVPGRPAGLARNNLAKAGMTRRLSHLEAGHARDWRGR